MGEKRKLRQFDVAVIGGGPGGTTAAALLAEQGWQVGLFEKDQHPRFHIGESLLPGNLAILDRLGVLGEIRDIAVHKPGADFTCEDGTVQSFPFARALGETPDHAYQVRRADFDWILFKNATRKGVQTFQKHRVTTINSHDNGHRLTVVDDQDKTVDYDCRLLIDASGRDAFVSRSRGWQSRSRRHASAAIFAHYRGVEQRTGVLAGNISVYWFEHGWVWMIPLTGEMMSVGVVCSPGYLKSRRSSLESFLKSTVASIAGASERMQNAEVVGEVNATGNYSYKSSQLFDDGLLVIGDAYAFIDPVFSSGVYLAMFGASECIDAAQSWLKGDQFDFKRQAKSYQSSLNGKIGAFAWFIYRFTTPTMRDLFRNPRNDWQVEQAVISMLAGDGDASADIRKRLRIFKTIYYLARLRSIRASLSAWWRRRRATSKPFEDETILP